MAENIKEDMRDRKRKNADAMAPSLVPVEIDSCGESIFGSVLTPRGRGPHPVSLILHGFPGHEKNTDLAHQLRGEGFVVVAFHYRGAWGSHGLFSFSNMLEDIKNVIINVRSDVFAKQFHTIKGSEVLIGHSMGGWGALMTASEVGYVKGIASLAGYNLGLLSGFARENELNRQMVLEGFGNQSRVLNSIGPEQLLEEVFRNGEKWDLKRLPGHLGNAKILLIGAEDDETAFPELHFHPLVKAFGERSVEDVGSVLIPGDHNFSGSRTQLRKEVISWTRALFNEH